jgi:hypothetical protein
MVDGLLAVNRDFRTAGGAAELPAVTAQDVEMIAASAPFISVTAYRVLGVATVYALFTACGGKTASAPGISEVLAAFEASNPGQGTQPESMDLDLYVDISESMRGFTSDPRSNYRRVLEALLEHTAASQYRVRRYTFSGGVHPADQLQIGGFLSPALYQGTSTPIAALMRRFDAGDSHKHLHVLISDMVQSDRGVDQIALVSALQSLVRRNVHLQILGFRSGFDGTYFVESSAGCLATKIPVSVTQRLPGLGRPFYLLVVAPDVASLARLRKTVLDRLGARESFTPTENPLPVASVEYAPSQRSGAIWRLLRRPERDPQTGAFYTAVMVSAEESRAHSGLRMRYAVTKHVVFEGAEKLEIGARTAAFERGRFEPPRRAGSLAADREFPADAFLNVTYRLPAPEPGVWQLYEFQIRGGTGNLSPPAWMLDWSTDNDCPPGEANRTHRLALFGRTLINAITEKIVVARHYIAVRRRD